MEMETYSDSTWTASANCSQRNTSGADDITENGNSQEEENVDIDATDKPSPHSSLKEQPITEQESILENTKVKADTSDPVLTFDATSSHKPSTPQNGENRNNHVTCSDGLSNSHTHVNNKNNNNDINSNDAIMDDEFDDEDDEDDDDDLIDNEGSLVVNMDVSDHLVKSEPPTSAPLSPLSVPKVTMSLTTTAAPLSAPSPPSKSPPSTPPQSSSPTPSQQVVTTMTSVEKKEELPLSLPLNRLAPPSQSMIDASAPKKVIAPCVQSSNVRSLPIHCVIEQTSPEGESRLSDACATSDLILDTYAILPGTTPFSDLVKASLCRLGYSQKEANCAKVKGGIQLKNWKTLSFDAVTDNAEATVETILGEITSVATLRIQLSSQARSSSSSDEVKEKLLQLLLTKSKDFLVQAGCPIEKTLLDAISTGEVSPSISDQVCTSFNDWYMRQKESVSPLSVTSSHSTSLLSEASPKSASSRMDVTSSTCSSSIKTPSLMSQSHMVDRKGMAAANVGRPASVSGSSLLPHELEKERSLIKCDITSKYQMDSGLPLNHNSHSFRGRGDSVSPHSNKNALDKTPEKNSFSMRTELYKMSRTPSEGNIPSTLQNHQANPYLGLMPGKTRIRTSFDPEHEIPRLQKWFGDNQHPTREQMMRFMHELNGLESRKGRRPLDLTNIIYWFKNARAAQRRATKALDDSFENEENMDMNSAGSGNSTTESFPPYLPNKNAVYMIPFHPYPHLLSGTGTGGRDENGVSSGAGVDEPYDLSLSKRPTSDLSKTHNGKDRGEINSLSQSMSPSPTKSSPTSSESECQADGLKKKKPYCPPRFPALLDVASKMRQEIPVRSDDIYFGNNNSISNHNGGRGSPYRSGSGSSDVEHSSKNEDTDNNFSNPSTPVQNGGCVNDQLSGGLKIKHEDGDYLSQPHTRKGYRHGSHTSKDSGLELGQLKKEEDVKGNSSEEDNTNDSYDSEEELKLRMKQNAAAAVVDYASAMHNNVSRLTAANMAALSLAQMGQPLHIPQLPPSLAMAYYPMDPRFYSQPTVPHSLSSSSPPTSLATTHQSHLSQLSLRQPQDSTSHLDSRSPLPSPSAMQQSMNQVNHHHHHHQHHQQQSPQQHHTRHHSEPRKRRTRVFIDPLTEIPKLEKWFTEDTHPSAFMIDKYCEELNKCEYRHKFPKLEPKNVQLWFKNHRAKVKRMKVSCDGKSIDGQNGPDDDLDD